MLCVGPEQLLIHKVIFISDSIWSFPIDPEFIAGSIQTKSDVFFKANIS